MRVHVKIRVTTGLGLACLLVGRLSTDAFSLSTTTSPARTDCPRRDLAKGPQTESRRSLLLKSIAFVTTANISFRSKPAAAAYGEASNIEVPSYIDFLIEKNSSVDPDDFLYKGADAAVQLKRLAEAATRLDEIPKIASARKWSQVQGILTGPLGTLIATMTQLSQGSADAKKAAALVKKDLYAIGEAASKKSEIGCRQATQDASRDLEVFVKLVF